VDPADDIAEFLTTPPAHNVRFHRTGIKHLHHPLVGDLELSYESMELSADEGLTMSIYTAEPGSVSQQALDLLAGAQAHGKSPAQVMLRWGLQHGRSVIPKSTKRERIAENLDVFDFELSADEMTAVDGLDTGRRGGPEPEDITLESFGMPIPEA
jgi:diketogulonate reductase-like aldo/keto reductase